MDNTLMPYDQLKIKYWKDLTKEITNEIELKYKAFTRKKITAA